MENFGEVFLETQRYVDQKFAAFFVTVKNIEFVIDPSRPEFETIVFSLSDGTSSKIELRFPIPFPDGDHNPEATYHRYDVVRVGSDEWIAQRDNPQNEPGNSSDWAIFEVWNEAQYDAARTDWLKHKEQLIKSFLSKYPQAKFTAVGLPRMVADDSGDSAATDEVPQAVLAFVKQRLSEFEFDFLARFTEAFQTASRTAEPLTIKPSGEASS